MQIRLDNICPKPLETALAKRKNQGEHSEVWQAPSTFLPGKFYQVYAPSGQGKSTFIHILYGLRKDFEGRVSLDDQDTELFKGSDWAQIRQTRFSIVFQDLRLFLDLSARENIQVNAALVSQDYAQNLEIMAEKLGILALMDRKTALLSYGERQRVAIIRALIQPFEWLLLDEPFSHLDEKNIEKASELILETCHQQKAGLLMTSLGYPYQINFDQRLLL